MSLDRMRLRYLVALGLAGGCRQPPSPPQSTFSGEPTGTSVGTASAASTATATGVATSVGITPPIVRETVERTALAEGSYEIQNVPDPNVRHPYLHRSPGCPEGKYCTPPNPAGARAEAPFEACAAETRVTGRWGGVTNSEVTFAPELTRSERAAAPERSQVCCYTWYQPCPGGRTLRDGSHALLATSGEREGWCDAASSGATLNEQLAEAWAREAAYEHASVASFNLAAVDWMSLGAPSDLVAGAQRAALDEIAHARVLYGLASARAGRPLGPGRLPLPSQRGEASFARVTAETFLDACVNECIAAAVAAERSRHAEEPEVKTALARIADDEERHAELAWRVLGWLVAAGGDEARDALSRALATLDDMPAPEPAPDAPSRGFLSAAAQRALRNRVVGEVVRPCAEALLA